MNESIKALHAALVAQVDALSARLATETDPALARAIADEIAETTHRLTLVGRQLFAETTASIDSKIERIEEAAGEARDKLDEIETVRDLIRLSPGLLKLVDGVIDAVKPRLA